jgi:CheY-like chemotaxis protein
MRHSITRIAAVHVILMDCQMPGMTLRPTAAIRRPVERRTQPTPIVALTANVPARDRTRCSKPA